MKFLKPVIFSSFFCALGLICTSLLFGSEAEQNPAPALSDFERMLIGIGFVDVQEMDPSIKVDLKYACTRNFIGVNLYGALRKGYLRREAAEMLASANRNLKRLHPDLTILVADGLRPRHVQRRMWETLKGTDMQNYVADPRRGSVHNYGCAVDVTIVGRRGEALDMGTPMDHFGILSQPRHEKRFLRERKLTERQVQNRAILRRAMTEAGFRPLPIEWWHFDAFPKEVVRKRYPIIE